MASGLICLLWCRCLGILLQKVHDRTYVCAKIDLMYKKANISFPKNRLGLAKAMGLVITCIAKNSALHTYLGPNRVWMTNNLVEFLVDLLILVILKIYYNNVWQVAASHLDTVLEKLKDILDNVGQSFFQRYILDAVL